MDASAPGGEEAEASRPSRGGQGKGGRGGRGKGGGGKGGGAGRSEGSGRAQGQGRSDQGRSQNRGGGGGGGGRSGGYGGSGAQVVPERLGRLPSPALPSRSGAPATPAAKRCVLCCSESPSYVGVGKCGHADVCWVCHLRLRGLAADLNCPMCKAELPEVVLTSDASASFPQAAELEKLDGESSLGIRFADDVIRRETSRLFEYRCHFQACARRSKAFRSLRELENHLWYTHWGQFCRTCLGGRSAFLCEQLVFDSRCLERHCREGEASRSGAEPPVPAHPYCEFCRIRVFDEDELAQHMHEQHHQCHICSANGRQNEFYFDIRCLAGHYMESHFVCPHPDCAHDGYRLAAFATEEERQLHVVKQHMDRSQLTEKERRELARPILQIGQRSYAEDRASAGSAGAKGAGRSSASAAAASAGMRAADVRFMWPGKEFLEDLPESRGDGGDGATRCGEALRKRYPDREPVSEDEVDARSGGRRAAAGGKAPRSEDAEGEEDADDAEEEEDAAAAEEAEAEEGGGDAQKPAPIQLEPRVEALGLESTVASAGRQQHMRCCLDALHAVLTALCGPLRDLSSSPGALRAAVGRLGLGDVDSLERLRKDLDSGDLSEECDWEPLERVLSLRPLFFRLLRSTRGGAGAGAGSRGAIGPQRRGGEDQSEAAWFEWRAAAQTAVLSLGERERALLQAYVVLCLRRRAELSSGGGPLAGDADAGELFPALGGGGGEGVADAPTWGASATNGLEQTQEDEEAFGEESFPTLGGGAGAAAGGPPQAKSWGGAAGARARAPPPSFGSGVTATPEAAAVRRRAAAPAPKDVLSADYFPGLGGGAAPSAAAASNWGASRAKAAASAPSAPAQRREEPSAAQRAPDMDADFFPGLGASGAAQPKSWAAHARERAAAVAAAAAAPAPEPEKKKAFKGIAAEAFPDLPISAPKPKTAAAKAGARASAAAAGAVAGAAARRMAAGARAARADAWGQEEDEEPQPELHADEDLVLLQRDEPLDPLEAVARTQAQQAAEAARKKQQKQAGKKKPVRLI